MDASLTLSRLDKSTGHGLSASRSTRSLRIARTICLSRWLLVATLFNLQGTKMLAQQQESAQALAERSAIVVRGKVLRANASDEPLVSASPRTAVIGIEEMYAGSEIAGDQKGRHATVILSEKTHVKEGEEALFFGNPRFVGRSLTIADEGEIVSTGAKAVSALSAVQAGMQARKDAPVVEQMGSAALVFRGSVESIRPVEGEAAEAEHSRSPRSEHDPEWHSAEVRITTSMRGGTAGETVTVLFAASRDIVWYHSPKLHTGEDAIFLAQPVDPKNAELFRTTGLSGFVEKQSAYLVTQSSDVLPANSQAHVEELLGRMKEKH